MENRVAAQSCTATASTNLTAKTESSTTLLTYHLCSQKPNKNAAKKEFSTKVSTNYYLVIFLWNNYFFHPDRSRFHSCYFDWCFLIRVFPVHDVTVDIVVIRSNDDIAVRLLQSVDVVRVRWQHIRGVIRGG